MDWHVPRRHESTVVCAPPTEQRQVRWLAHDAAEERLSTVAAWVHREEVWDVACCPSQPFTFATVHSKGACSACDWGYCAVRFRCMPQDNTAFHPLPPPQTHTHTHTALPLPSCMQAVGVYGATLWRGDPARSQLTAVAQLLHTSSSRGAAIRRCAPSHDCHKSSHHLIISYHLILGCAHTHGGGVRRPLLACVPRSAPPSTLDAPNTPHDASPRHATPCHASPRRTATVRCGAPTTPARCSQWMSRRCACGTRPAPCSRWAWSRGVPVRAQQARPAAWLDALLLRCVWRTCHADCARACSCLTAPQATTPDTQQQQQQQQQPMWTAALHPQQPQLVLTAAGSCVQLWDTSAGLRAPAASLPGAGQGLPLRDVCWAPQNSHRFASAGDDGKLRCWDTRCAVGCVARGVCCCRACPRHARHPAPQHTPQLQPRRLLARGPAEALLQLSGHSHWVWRCCYSPWHDQLLASASTDTTVCLWFLPQLAKQPGPAPRQQQQQQPASGGGRWACCVLVCWCVSASQQQHHEHHVRLRSCVRQRATAHPAAVLLRALQAGGG
jgi:hypothetical protein